MGQGHSARSLPFEFFAKTPMGEIKVTSKFSLVSLIDGKTSPPFARKIKISLISLYDVKTYIPFSSLKFFI